MELMVRNDVIPFKEDLRGMLREWWDLDLLLKTVFQCKFGEPFGSYFSAGSDEAAQQFQVTTRKAICAVVRHIGSAMSELMEQYMSMAPLHPMLIGHGVWDRLADSIISLGGALSMRGMLSAKELENLGPQYLKLYEVVQGIAGTHRARSVTFLAGLGRMEEVPSSAEGASSDDCHCERWGVCA